MDVSRLRGGARRTTLDIIDTLTGDTLGQLRSAPGHEPDPAHLSYHRERVGR